MNKLPRKNIRYYSKKKGIHGLTVANYMDDTYCVIEDTVQTLDWNKRKISYKGTLSECRQYVRNRFSDKEGKK